MQNPSQELPVPNKAPTQDLKDMDVPCTFKIKIGSQHSDYECIKDQWPYPYQDKDTKPCQEPPAPTKAPNQDLNYVNVLCTFKMKKEGQNLEYWCIKDQ